MEETGDTTRLCRWIERLDQGDEAAMGELICHFQERLLHLAEKMLRRFPGVTRWEAGEDLRQMALIRLSRSLRDVKPESSRQFFGFAALQLRRELLNLAERYSRLATTSGNAISDLSAPSTNAPDTLISWTEFHATVDALPEQLAVVFRLVWYDGLTQSEVADLLCISLKTVKNRWRDARIKLSESLPDRFG